MNKRKRCEKGFDCVNRLVGVNGPAGVLGLSVKNGLAV